jgi:hypothetical protein
VATQYLLGRLTDADAEQVQERLLLDDDFYNEVRLAEDDLLDDWARDQLSSADRADLEERMLASSLIRERANIAAAFVRGSRMATAHPQRSDSPSRAMLLALAACLVLGFSTLWLGARNESLQKQLTSRDHGSPGSPPNVVTLAFRSETVRGASTIPSLTVAPSAEFVRLDLHIDPAEPSSQFAAVLKDRQGALIWRRDALSSVGADARRHVILWLPAAVLTPGRYEVELLAGADPVAFYEFDLR